MGSLSRANMSDKLAELYEKEIRAADVVVTVTGGIPYIEINKKGLTVMTIDIDNAEDYTSAEMTREIAEDNGIVGWEGSHDDGDDQDEDSECEYHTWIEFRSGKRVCAQCEKVSTTTIKRIDPNEY